MTLRSYQSAAITELVRLARQHRRIVLCGPCSMGKTVLASAIIESAIRDFGVRVLFVAPFIQLINQAYDAFEHLKPGVIRGDDPRRSTSAIQIASVQTLVRRDLPPADVIIVDECHISSQHVVQEMYPNATIIGLSATPMGLAGVYDAIVTAASYQQLIAEGFIAEPDCFGAPPLDLSNVRTSQGDYAVGQLEQVMLGTRLVGNVVDAYHKHSRGHRTAVFAVGIAHSRAIVDQFAKAGIVAEHIDASTSVEERAAVLARVESGETRVVSSVGTLTTGWNQPSVKCGIIARPTKSLVLWRQMTGRLLRVWNDTRPVIIDLGGNIDRHGYPHDDFDWTLTEAKRRARVPFKTCPKCFAYQDAANKKCVSCGEVFVAEARPLPQTVDLSLLQRTKPTDDRRAYFIQQWSIARAKGHKPGFAGALYKEKYGEWPPWAWSSEVKDDFAKDATWQARLAAKEERKREREEQENGPPPAETVAAPAETQLVSSIDDSPENADYFSSSGFAEWLEAEGVA